MELPDRLVRVYPLSDGRVFATDVRGRMHILDERLKLQHSSPVIPDGSPTYAIALTDDYVVTKDRTGNIMKWRLKTLEPCDRLEAHEVRSPGASYLEGEEPSPVINRGIAIWRGRVYVNNGYMQIVVIDLETFEVLKIVESFSPIFLEWFCLDGPGLQAVSDKAGTLFLGDLETLDFPIRVRVDEESNVHRVLYDPRHGRYWATQDSGDSSTARVSNGIVTVLPDGTIEQSLLFAADDVECLAFSSDYSKAFAGGFDGDLLVFDNTEREVTIERSVHVFSHEIIDLAVLRDGSLAVLTQDGHLVRTNEQGEPLDNAEYRNQCIWDIQPLPASPAHYRVATDTGIHTIEIRDGVGGPYAVPVDDWRTEYGFVRRLLCTPTLTFGVTHGRDVFCFDENGAEVWRVAYPSRLHAIALDATGERLLVASDDGAFEHSADDGELIASFGLDVHHIWAVSYLASGERVIASHHAQVAVFGDDTRSPLWSVFLDGYPKRMRADDEFIYVTGGGGLRQISIAEHRVVRSWNTMLDNTVENFAFHGQHVYAVSYGCQLGVFDVETTEGLGLVEPLPDFPKGLALHRSLEHGDHLLVGGRGGYLQIRRLESDGEPVLTRTAWVSG